MLTILLALQACSDIKISLTTPDVDTLDYQISGLPAELVYNGDGTFSTTQTEAISSLLTDLINNGDGTFSGTFNYHIDGLPAELADDGTSSGALSYRIRGLPIGLIDNDESTFQLFNNPAPSIAKNLLPKPVFLDSDNNGFVPGDDRAAILHWNSKGLVNHSNPANDPEKQTGVYGYYVEWGKVGEDFPNKEVTPYRAYMAQPLKEGEIYQARVSAMDSFGGLSTASDIVSFRHDSTRVDDRRRRMNGFFDDFNTPMGAFNELLWNQAYSGCADGDKVGQHVNSEFHGHNVLTTIHCDRGVANSRARKVFDFTNRTGVIEFDLDGSKGTRQLWYLDLIAAEGNLAGAEDYSRKRDITGHVALDATKDAFADPPHMLRLLQGFKQVSLQYVKADGNIVNLTDIYRNGACGENLNYCQDSNGESRNLEPLNNIRKPWRIELSKNRIQVFIESIRVIDADLNAQNGIIPAGGLPYQKVHAIWLFFSYNTAKENIAGAMVHWDNFGWDQVGVDFDPVVHNYTDGITGSGSYTGNNCCGPAASLTQPHTTTVPIPDPINQPYQAELMFTLQGLYRENSANKVEINGHIYPVSALKSATDLTGEALVYPIIPYSVLMEIDPAHLIQGDNQLKFYLDSKEHVGVFNIHIELSYNQSSQPYTQPFDIFSSRKNYIKEILPNLGAIGPGIIFDKIADVESWTFEKQHDTHGAATGFIMETTLSGIVNIEVSGNSKAQLIGTGHSKGISYYQLLIDTKVVKTIRLDDDVAVSFFQHKDLTLDTTRLCNGQHELFIKAYAPDGSESFFDFSLSHAIMGDYTPVKITTSNSGQTACL